MSLGVWKSVVIFQYGSQLKIPNEKWYFANEMQIQF